MLRNRSDFSGCEFFGESSGRNRRLNRFWIFSVTFPNRIKYLVLVLFWLVTRCRDTGGRNLEIQDKGSRMFVHLRPKAVLLIGTVPDSQNSESLFVREV